jgi:hypothetical protein
MPSANLARRPARSSIERGLHARRGAVDSPDMRCMRFAILILLAGCHLRAGLDATSRASGPLHNVMSRSTVSREDGVINLPPANGRNASLEAGIGVGELTLNGLVAVHDVSSTSFTPGAGYLATTLGANVRWRVLRWHGLAPTVAAGPARVLLLDRMTGERTWGNAIRASGGAEYRLGPITIYGDLYREMVHFGDGPATGTTSLDGFTLGLAIQP